MHEQRRSRLTFDPWTAPTAQVFNPLTLTSPQLRSAAPRRLLQLQLLLTGSRPRVYLRSRSWSGSDMLGGDVVAVWEVDLNDGVYRIEFAHGTTTGKRIVYVNGQEVIRKDWLFKLVGRETFSVGVANTRASILIEAVSGFSYEYSLELEGQSLQKFTQTRSRTTRTWTLSLDGDDCRVVLEKDTMEVWCNGHKMETRGEFVEDGTETVFTVGEHELCIKATNSGKKKSGIVHHLLLDGAQIPAAAPQ